jgi:catechol 2,3-dioxygenase-like lactoylglutathione lyase family enzyme
MQVEQVDFVSVPTRDSARAVAWYRDVLGLPVQGEKFVPNENGIALRFADVEAAVEEVRGQGAELMGIQDSGVCHMGFVKDPDGNVLILHRRYKPRG